MEHDAEEEPAQDGLNELLQLLKEANDRAIEAQARANALQIVLTGIAALVREQPGASAWLRRELVVKAPHHQLFGALQQDPNDQQELEQTSVLLGEVIEDVLGEPL